MTAAALEHFQPATPAEALRVAVDLIGSQAKTARLLGVAQPSVWKWLNKGQHLPAEHVLAVEAATGISRYELRPDIYPQDDAPPARDLGTMEPAR